MLLSEHHSIGGKPSFAYADVKFVVEEFRAHEEAFSFGLVITPQYTMTGD